MIRTTISLIILLTAAIMFSQAGYAAGTLKKWKDKDGQWHFGDVIPPEYSQQAHEELNKQGMTVEVQDRAKTDAEIAKAKKQEAIAEEKKREAEEQARHDHILLDTYSSVDDMEMARDGKVQAIQSRISLAQNRIEKIQKDLNDRMEAAAAQERSGKAPNPELKKDIDSLHRQVSNQEEFIKQQNQDIEDVKASYEKDIERYKLLKSGKTTAAEN